MYEARSRQKRVYVCVCVWWEGVTHMCAGVPGGKKRVWVRGSCVGVRGSCETPGVALGTKLCVLHYLMREGKRKPATS